MNLEAVTQSVINRLSTGNLCAPDMRCPVNATPLNPIGSKNRLGPHRNLLRRNMASYTVGGLYSKHLQPSTHNRDAPGPSRVSVENPATRTNADSTATHHPFSNEQFSSGSGDQRSAGTGSDRDKLERWIWVELFKFGTVNCPESSPVQSFLNVPTQGPTRR